MQANLRLASDGTSDVMRKGMLKRWTFENVERVRNREVNVVEGECDSPWLTSPGPHLLCVDLGLAQSICWGVCPDSPRVLGFSVPCVLACC